MFSSSENLLSVLLSTDLSLFCLAKGVRKKQGKSPTRNVPRNKKVKTGLALAEHVHGTKPRFQRQIAKNRAMGTPLVKQAWSWARDQTKGRQENIRVLQRDPQKRMERKE
jgi:hypothetical protein